MHIYPLLFQDKVVYNKNKENLRLSDNNKLMITRNTYVCIELENKTTSHLLGYLLSKKQKMSFGKDVEKLQSLCTVGRDENGATTVENSIMAPQKM